MVRLKPLIAILSLTLISLNSQGQDLTGAWLKERSTTVRTIDPNDEEFADLQPLKKAIGSSRVVLLGEQTHADGATYYAKTRLIKFLHQQMGFDVLVWESGLYD